MHLLILWKNVTALQVSWLHLQNTTKKWWIFLKLEYNVMQCPNLLQLNKIIFLYLIFQNTSLCEKTVIKNKVREHKFRIISYRGDATQQKHHMKAYLTWATVWSGHQLRTRRSLRNWSSKLSYPSGTTAFSGASASNQAFQAFSFLTTCTRSSLKGHKLDNCTRLSHVMSRIHFFGFGSTEFRSRLAPPAKQNNYMGKETYKQRNKTLLKQKK